jgi:hypothetical protein
MEADTFVIKTRTVCAVIILCRPVRAYIGITGFAQVINRRIPIPDNMTSEEKGKVCDVEGCSSDAERSLNVKQVSQTELRLKPGEHRQVHLCKTHYREFKKQTKKTRDLDRIY